MRKWIRLLFIFFMIYSFAIPVQAARPETDWSDLDEKIAEIDQSLQDSLIVHTDFSLKDIMDYLYRGDIKGAISWTFSLIQEQMIGGLREHQLLLYKIAGIAVISAIFTNFSMAFSKEQVARTGFYLTYSLLMTLLMTSFVMASDIVTGVLQAMTDFMKVLLPAFCMAITVTTGSLLAGAYYEWMLIAISVANWLMGHVIMRLIQIYILIMLVNHLSEKDDLSKMGELFETFIGWSNKTIVAIILGIHMLQTMLLPAIDRAKNSVLFRLIASVPGVGSAINTTFGAMIGSGLLIRNVMGTGGLIAIFLICAVPVLKLAFIWFSYKIVQAFIQPVSDQRIVDGIESMINGIRMLLQILTGCALMLMLSIAIICHAGSIYGG